VTRVSVRQVKAQFSELVRRAARGEDIVITRAGVPVARLVPAARPAATRSLGTDAGMYVAPDEFDAPLPPEIEARFLG